MPYITPLEKPEIWLVGNVISSDGVPGYHQGPVDHSTYSYTHATNIIESKTVLNKDDILTFDESVRVVITGRVDPRPNYARQKGALNNLEFEGNVSYNTKAGNVNANQPDQENLVVTVAETYYTLNGADPRRHPLHLYNYLDLNSRIAVAAQEREANPSDPSQAEIRFVPREDNISTLGFVISSSPTGSDLITLKARTFFDGKVSPISMAVFNLHRNIATIISNSDE